MATLLKVPCTTLYCLKGEVSLIEIQDDTHGIL